jgi:hypothetical protein
MTRRVLACKELNEFGLPGSSEKIETGEADRQ